MTCWTRTICILSMALLALMAATTSYALDVVVDVAEDTYIDGWNPDTAMGGPTGNPFNVWIGGVEDGRYRAGVLKFNLPQNVVSSASLSLYVIDYWGTIVNHRVLPMGNNWNETTATATSIWATGGVGSSPLDMIPVDYSNVGSRVQWNVTSAVQAAGPGGTVSFYVEQYPGYPGPGKLLSQSKEGDATLTNTAKLNLTLETGVLQGYIELQAWDMANVNLTPVEINLVPTSNGAPKTVKVDLDPNNINYNYSVSDITPGTYDVYYTCAKHLRKRETGVVIAYGGITTQDTSLVNGDVDGDNVLSIGDAGITLWNENMEGD